VEKVFLLTSLELGNTSFVTRVHRFVGSTFMVHADDFNRILQFLPIVPWAIPRLAALRRAH